ncbi:MAG: hypothetical protein ACRC0V_07435 [Fusobacteriaceae bacterium]
MNLLEVGVQDGLIHKTEETKQLRIDGISKNYPVYKIKLDVLFYNDQNDRIATWISSNRSELENLKKQDIVAYNNTIQDFIVKSNEVALNKTKKNIQIMGQQEVGVILFDGRIIDGNRRFTCLRNIEKEVSETQYFKAVILEQDIKRDSKQIKLLELYLQHGVDKIVDYNPIDKLIGIYNDIVDENTKLLSIKEYAKATSREEKDIKKDIEIANLVIEFLAFIDSDRKFHLARELSLDGPLRELYLILNKCKTEDQKHDIKNLVFAQLLVQSTTDMTRYIRKISTIASNKKYLNEYIEENQETLEKVCDVINNDMSIDDIKKIRNERELGESFTDKVDKYVIKVDADVTKNLPAAQIKKAIANIELIDELIISKLKQEQRNEISEKISELEELINLIKREI